MATRKKHQLDINLNHVQDPATREALLSIVNQVNQLSQDIEVSTRVKAESFKTHSDLFNVGPDGVVKCSAMNIDGGGPIKAQVISGSLAASASKNLLFPDDTKILGCIGFSQVGGTSIWRPMVIDSGLAGSSIYFSKSTSVESNKAIITSNDGSSTNEYRVIVFYSVN